MNGAKASREGHFGKQATGHKGTQTFMAEECRELYMRYKTTGRAADFGR
jgi:hypothetical protein